MSKVKYVFILLLLSIFVIMSMCSMSYAVTIDATTSDTDDFTSLIDTGSSSATDGTNTTNSTSDNGLTTITLNDDSANNSANNSSNTSDNTNNATTSSLPKTGASDTLILLNMIFVFTGLLVFFGVKNNRYSGIK